MTIDGAYSQPTCTPSRVAFLTGKYPFKLGFGEGVLNELAPGGIRPNEILLPKYLKDLGYETHGFGKWHVGYCAEELVGFHIYALKFRSEKYLFNVFFALYRNLKSYHGIVDLTIIWASWAPVIITTSTNCLGPWTIGGME